MADKQTIELTYDQIETMVYKILKYSFENGLCEHCTGEFIGPILENLPDTIVDTIHQRVLRRYKRDAKNNENVVNSHQH